MFFGLNLQETNSKNHTVVVAGGLISAPDTGLSSAEYFFASIL
jgi:hypothetical protein